MAKKNFWKEFRDFIKEYQIVALAMGFIMGSASQALVRSLVENIIMPFATVLFVNGAWQNATLHLGPLSLRWGAFLGELINFIIIALVVFFIVKKILKADKIENK